jgi:sugar lactone lactonase YvrE
MSTVDIPFGFRCELGEGPHWDAASASLLFVDINQGVVHQLDPVTGVDAVLPVAPYVSLVVPVGDGSGDRVCAVKGDVVVLARDGTVGPRRVLEADRPGNRINDGKADPAGRLWCGSMSLTWEPERSSLYRVDATGVSEAVPGVTLSNGLDWDAERGRMYYIDSPTQRVDVFDYDHATGAIANRRPFATIDPADGLPDGMTVDADGCVWVALFGGGALRRYDPDGALMTVLELPVRHPTSIAFGGPELATMFVTTSRHKLTEAERADQPNAGAIVVVDAGVRGRPANEVAPDVAAAIARLTVNDTPDTRPPVTSA